MRELRIQSHGDPLRVLYAFEPKADALYDEHLINLQSHSKP